MRGLKVAGFIKTWKCHLGTFGNEPFNYSKTSFIRSSFIRFSRLYVFFLFPCKIPIHCTVYFNSFIYTFFRLYVFFSRSLQKRINEVLLYRIKIISVWLNFVPIYRTFSKFSFSFAQNYRTKTCFASSKATGIQIFQRILSTVK